MTDRETLTKKAQALRDFHSGEKMLVLPCAWDAASARVFELAGAKAIGTTSLGVAALFGQRDGQRIRFDDYLNLVRCITDLVDPPVTVDIEAGFADDPKEIAANMRAVLDAGAVGVNIEDLAHARNGSPSLVPVPAMLERLGAIRDMSRKFGVHLFINARTDAVWQSPGKDPEAALQNAIERGNAYGSAGADCIFVPGHLDLAAVTRLVQSIRHPLNVVVKAKSPSLTELQQAGVKRASLGSGPMRASLGLTRRIARECLSQGLYSTMIAEEIPLDEVENMFPD